MNNKDRREILAQLQDTFVPEEKRESRLTTEVLRIDNHNVARVTQIKDPPLEDQIYAKYPDTVSIKEMIMLLRGNSESSVKEAGGRLRKSFVDAFDDEEMLMKIADICRDYESMYYSTADDIKKQLLLYRFVSEFDKIKNIK